METKEPQHPHPIVVNRMGGLGNQLFQYAAARAVAHHHPGQIYVQEETDNPHNHKKYDYALIFMKHAVVAQVSPSYRHEFHQASSFVPWQPETIHPPVKLFGYFQYLPAIQPILFDLVLEYRDALCPFRPHFVSPETSLFIHVRRGDYLKLPQYHYIQTKTYYENAFREWRKHYVGDDFHVFLMSDDPEWCREQSWSFPYILYENDDEVQTLAMMSQCTAGAIISNSSFSYWVPCCPRVPVSFTQRDGLQKPSIIYSLLTGVVSKDRTMYDWRI